MAAADIATRVYDHTWKLDPIIRSILDTDFYKLLMLQMIRGLHPDLQVTFSLINAPESTKGKKGSGIKPITKTIAGGQTLRIKDVLKALGVKFGGGVVALDSPGVDGVYPLALGETYTTAGPNVYGETVPALGAADLVKAGSGQALLALREDNLYRTMLWLQNGGTEAGTVELTYRSPAGAQLGKVVLNVATGKAMQVGSRIAGALPKTYTGAFSIELRVTKGQFVAGAQLINKATSDLAFVAGLPLP